MPITRHAFPKTDCSGCSTRRARLKEIAKLEGDIVLLKTFNVPTPKATSQLDILKHFQAMCNEGKCH